MKEAELTVSNGGLTVRRYGAKGVLLLALLVASYLGFLYFYPQTFIWIGIAHYGAWFVDAYAILASNDAVSYGLDPYLPNPLDIFRRPHVYSQSWLHLHEFGLNRSHIHAVGVSLVVSFFAAALWKLRPREPRQLLWYAAVLCSSPVILAVERGNNDLVIFILLAPLATCLVDDRRIVRLVAPFLVALAAILKYYPAAAGLALLAVADAKELRARLVIVGLLFIFVAINTVENLSAFTGLAPKAEGLLSFGATAFFHELGWEGWVPKLVVVAAGLLAMGILWHRQPLKGWTAAPDMQEDHIRFIVGAALLTGCFFTSLNFSYRLVFALWLAPLLWRLPRDLTAPPSVRRFARVTGWLLMGVLWVDLLICVTLNSLLGVVPISTVIFLAKSLYLAEQPMVWAFFVCLLGFLVQFGRERVRVLFGG